jgi:hypothetical protein
VALTGAAPQIHPHFVTLLIRLQAETLKTPLVDSVSRAYTSPQADCVIKEADICTKPRLTRLRSRWNKFH